MRQGTTHRVAVLLLVATLSGTAAAQTTSEVTGEDDFVSVAGVAAFHLGLKLLAGTVGAAAGLYVGTLAEMLVCSACAPALSEGVLYTPVVLFAPLAVATLGFLMDHDGTLSGALLGSLAGAAAATLLRLGGVEGALPWLLLPAIGAAIAYEFSAAMNGPELQALPFVTRGGGGLALTGVF